MNEVSITFLGTGVSTPTASRNHTGILVSSGEENMLIDCGEGIQRQFKKAEINMNKLTKLFITHWHGDHTLGIVGLLQTLATSEYRKTLQIYGPIGTKEKFALLEKVYGRPGINFTIHESSGKIFESKDLLIEAFQMSHHIHTNAYSIILKEKIRLRKDKLRKLKLPNSPLIGKLQKGQDIVYKGKKIKAKNITYREPSKKIAIVLDTAENQNILRAAKDADVFISEASFSENEKEKAKTYKHLTASQAASLAKKAKAKKLFLTHISKRYENNLGSILKEAKKHFKNVKIPNDFDKISI